MYGAGCNKYHTGTEFQAPESRWKQLYQVAQVAYLPTHICSFVSIEVRPRSKLLHACTRLFRRLFVANVSSVLELPCLYVGVLGLGQPLGGILACGRAEVQNWVGLMLDLKYLFKKESHS